MVMTLFDKGSGPIAAMLSEIGKPRRRIAAHHNRKLAAAISRHLNRLGGPLSREAITLLVAPWHNLRRRAQPKPKRLDWPTLVKGDDRLLRPIRRQIDVTLVGGGVAEPDRRHVDQHIDRVWQLRPDRLRDHAVARRSVDRVRNLVRRYLDPDVSGAGRHTDCPLFRRYNRALLPPMLRCQGTQTEVRMSTIGGKNSGRCATSK